MYVVGDRVAVRCSLTGDLHVGKIFSLSKTKDTKRDVYALKVDCSDRVYHAIANNDTIYPVRKLRGNKIV